MNHPIFFSDGLLLFFGTYFIEARLAIVLAFVFAAAAFDLRTQRIPNWLVFSGTLVGIGYQTFSPYDHGAAYALQGLAVGLAAFLPFYMLRAMGAGDVKLMAMVGAFLGPGAALGAVLMTFVAGGVLAIALAMSKGALRSMLANVRSMLLRMLAKATPSQGLRIEALPSSTAGSLPYALAIATGTLLQIWLVSSGRSIL